MTGRKPKPAQLIDRTQMKLDADYVNQRREVEESLVALDQLKCPSTLSAPAKKEWKRVMKIYKTMGAKILNDLDITALSMYCESVAIYKKAQETWVKYQVLITTNKEAQKVLDKMRNIMNKQIEVIIKLSEQLCLTPVGRARMGIAIASKKESKLDAIFKDDD